MFDFSEEPGEEDTAMLPKPVSLGEEEDRIHVGTGQQSVSDRFGEWAIRRSSEYMLAARRVLT
jgi:hypothetical protein